MVIWIAAGVLGLLGIVLTFAGVRGSGRKPVSGGFGALIGLALMGAGGFAALLGVNLRTYERLTSEQMAARLDFVQQGAQSYQATLTLPDGEVKIFELMGDDWQLDARVIKFPGWANVAGLDAVYRLDRIAGRYENVDQEINGVRTVYKVYDDAGIDVWTLARERGRSLQIDASFGSGVYHPMANGASYEISMTQSALVSRPVNPAATEAVGRWDGRNPPPPIPENLIVQN